MGDGAIYRGDTATGAVAGIVNGAGRSVPRGQPPRHALAGLKARLCRGGWMRAGSVLCGFLLNHVIPDVDRGALGEAEHL